MIEKQRTEKGYGIRRKYLRDVIGLLALALLLSSIGVVAYVRQSMQVTITEKYEFLTEKMGLSLERLFLKSDEVTAECIVNEDVQRSLRARPLEELERNSLSKYFAYAGMEHVLDYLYIDNKENLYTRAYSSVTPADFQASGFTDLLRDSYAETKWFWAEDKLFGTDQPALFIGRNVRALEYAHEPGMLFFKMDESLLDSIINQDQEKTGDIAIGIMDREGTLVKSWIPDDYQLADSDRESVRKVVAQASQSGLAVAGQQIAGGVLTAYHQEQAGLTVFTLIPDHVIWKDMGRIIAVLIGIFLLVIIIALNLSIYFSKRFTRPIRQISEAMTAFDGEDFSGTIRLHTNTELDRIGDSYNHLLKNIEQLLKEIKEQEKELRTSELNMLISQINPHFLYNTLDTIYMLARINKEETTMKMIQALSKYLRISLSKGSDMVTVADELENVKSYMEIQQIRNDQLFRFEVDCRVDEQKPLLKLILQPLVENSIKHGFREIFQGGLIRIEVFQEGDFLVLTVFNNGTPMTAAVTERINALNGCPVTAISELFPGQKEGYGVTNIITRLRLKYGDRASFGYYSDQQGTICTIKIPERDEHEE